MRRGRGWQQTRPAGLLLAAAMLLGRKGKRLEIECPSVGLAGGIQGEEDVTKGRERERGDEFRPSVCLSVCGIDGQSSRINCDA